MRKMIWLSLLLVLCACTYLPDAAPTPQPCPTMQPCTVIQVLPTTPPTAAPTATPLPIPTDAPPVGEPTSTPPPIPVAGRYQVEAGSPRLVADFSHPGQGCAWAGVAGQVLDERGEAERGRVLVVAGGVNGNPFDAISLSGSAPMFGPGGFEVTLPAAPTREGTLTIQVFDLNGLPISEAVAFDMPTTCAETLVMVNFRRLP